MLSLPPSCNDDHTVASLVPADAVVASKEPRSKGGRVAGLDKTGSDAINVIILNVVLTNNKMVGSFLGHVSKASTKFFSSKKEALDMLMIGLRKHNNRVVNS